ncbi:hypothetical protein PVAP13_8KG311814 [Panicum virgatum]|uniref:Uncharacterized protein n=1 Tax=Panicum virgatum TaxID=38727 RepID=A0A8T0PLL0_PANVG|nr:hypothetical protein PVAP13_8KG311814 [Panicum virgatum]
MLEAARRPRVTGDLELRFLDFLKKELSFIVAGLTALSPQHGEDEMVRWLRKLTDGRASGILPRALGEADPQRHNTLLRRAARFFRRRHRSRHTFELLLYAAETFYSLAEDPCRYRHLVPATSRHGLPPQAAEEGDASGLNLLIMLCMSMFPYGYKFDKDRLVMRWLFEGIFSFRVFFVYSSKEEAEAEAEAEAGEYFTILSVAMSSPMQHQIPDDALIRRMKPGPGSGMSISFVQFLATKSAAIGFAFTSATLNLLAEASATGHDDASRIPHRLALHHDDPNIPSLLQEIDLSQTRSLAVSGAVSIGGVPSTGAGCRRLGEFRG